MVSKKQLFLQKISDYVGLQNKDNRCYINAIIQCFYMNVDFRKFILNLHLNEKKFDASLLKELQRLFEKLQVLISKIPRNYL